jgi:hypothetical protein
MFIDGAWVESANGATFNVPDGQGHMASPTLAGYTTAQADRLDYSVGETGGHSYLHLS